MTRIPRALALVASAAAFAAPAIALPGDTGEEKTHSHGFSHRVDSHAPIGVMGDHMHKAGEWMVSYRFMFMRMDGNRDGTRSLGANEVFAEGFPVSPTDMDMEMHMVGLMYAPTDWITLTAMMPYIKLDMDHVVNNAQGTTFETHSGDPGDLQVSSLLRLWENESHHVHANVGWGFPTGNIRIKANTPGGNATLPYPMRTGSGSFTFMPGLTYLGHSDGFSWGFQAMGTIHMTENRSDYRRGDGASTTAWVARPWMPWLSTSARIAYSYWGNYRGDDQRLNPNLVPTADPDRRRGHRIDLAPGVNIKLPLGPLGTHRVAIEAVLPVYQWLDGPQLETDWGVTVGWQKAFKRLWPPWGD